MAEFDLDTIKGLVTRKLGPLKTWQWGLIGAGGILVWRRLHSRPVEAARTSGETGSISGLAGEGALYSTLSGGGAGALATSSPPPIEAGFGADAEANRVYFAKGDFTYEGPGDQASAFLKLFYPPPVVVVPTPSPSPVPAAPKPTPVATAPAPVPVAPKPVAPKLCSYTIVKGDTLSKIAAAKRTTLTVLKQYNPTLFNAAHSGGNLIHPGEVVKYPC